MNEMGVGKLFVLGFEGCNVPKELIAFSDKFGLGGVILFQRNCIDQKQLLDLTTEIRRRFTNSGETPLIMVDQEGGRVQRIKDGVPNLPPAGILAANDLSKENQTLFQRLIEEQADALARLGINVNLAPVCDLADKNDVGVIGDRAFGPDPILASKFIKIHIRACLSKSVVPCAKHFPGHGAALGDSHAMLPETARSLKGFKAKELKSFTTAIEAGTPLIMASHILCQGISSWPVSLSPRWLGADGILRKNMGYKGAVISDDMEMGALQDLGNPERIALQAVEAGCDLLIYGRMMRPDIDTFSIAEFLSKNLSLEKLRKAISNIRPIRRKCKNSDPDIL